MGIGFFMPFVKTLYFQAKSFVLDKETGFYFLSFDYIMYPEGFL